MATMKASTAMAKITVTLHCYTTTAKRTPPMMRRKQLILVACALWQLRRTECRTVRGEGRNNNRYGSGGPRRSASSLSGRLLQGLQDAPGISLLPLFFREQHRSNVNGRNETTLLGSDKSRGRLPDLHLENFLRIDFSGDLDCHIIGPSHHHHHPRGTARSSSPGASYLSESFLSDSFGDERSRGSAMASTGASTAALIRTPRGHWSSWWIPDWFVGIHYDFGRCWYGATRIWNHWHFGGAAPTITVECTVDRSILASADRTTEVALRWRRAAAPFANVLPSTSIQGRVESLTGTASLSFQVPLHRRFSYEYKIVSDSLVVPAMLSFLEPATVSYDDYENNLSAASLSSRPSARNPGRPSGFHLPEPTQLNDDDTAWWLPDLTLHASGLIDARNRVVFPHPTRLYDGRAAVRFGIRRHLLWGQQTDLLAGGGAEPVTALAIELQDMQSHAINAVRIQTELERPLEALRLAFVQQRYHCPRSLR